MLLTEVLPVPSLSSSSSSSSTSFSLGKFGCDDNSVEDVDGWFWDGENISRTNLGTLYLLVFLLSTGTIDVDTDSDESSGVDEQLFDGDVGVDESDGDENDDSEGDVDVNFGEATNMSGEGGRGSLGTSDKSYGSYTSGLLSQLLTLPAT